MTTGYVQDNVTGAQLAATYNGLLLQRGTTAARPAASTGEGIGYWNTDDVELQQSDGAAWQTRIDSDAAAGTPSLRSLGSGAQQAAAGNHTH